MPVPAAISGDSPAQESLARTGVTWRGVDHHRIMPVAGPGVGRMMATCRCRAKPQRVPAQRTLSPSRSTGPREPPGSESVPSRSLAVAGAGDVTVVGIYHLNLNLMIRAVGEPDSEAQSTKDHDHDHASRNRTRESEDSDRRTPSRAAASDSDSTRAEF